MSANESGATSNVAENATVGTSKDSGAGSIGSLGATANEAMS